MSNSAEGEGDSDVTAQSIEYLREVSAHYAKNVEWEGKEGFTDAMKERVKGVQAAYQRTVDDPKNLPAFVYAVLDLRAADGQRTELDIAKEKLFEVGE